MDAAPSVTATDRESTSRRLAPGGHEAEFSVNAQQTAARNTRTNPSALKKILGYIAAAIAMACMILMAAIKPLYGTG